MRYLLKPSLLIKAWHARFRYSSCSIHLSADNGIFKTFVSTFKSNSLGTLKRNLTSERIERQGTASELIKP